MDQSQRHFLSPPWIAIRRFAHRRNPEIKVGLLVCISAWAFCRFYYCAFYLIEHYVDPSYRFSGLRSFARSFYLLSSVS
jgi:hypothetical protein